MGALVGGVYANDEMNAFRDWMVTLDKRKVFRLVDFTLSRTGLVKGDKVFNKMKDFIPDTPIEKLRIPFAAVAVDLINNKEVVFREGSLFEAIRASVSIPTVLTPVKTTDGLLVDGGVLNNIPISHAPRVPGDLLMVVNVNARIPVQRPDISKEQDEKQKRAYRKKIEEFQSYLLKIRTNAPAESNTQKQDDKMGFFNLIDKTIGVMTYHMAQMSLNYFSPDALIEISRDSCGTYDFFKAGEMVEMGRAATKEALNNLEAKQGSL